MLLINKTQVTANCYTTTSWAFLSDELVKKWETLLTYRAESYTVSLECTVYLLRHIDYARELPLPLINCILCGS